MHNSIGKNSIIIVLLIITVIFGGCTNAVYEGFHIEKQGDLQVFNNLKSEVNANRKAIIESSEPIDISKYTPDFKDDLHMFSEDEIKNLVEPKEMKNITKQEAKDDVEVAFNMLKYSYGAYEYFGGDEAFNKAKEDVLKKIDLMTDEIIAIEDLQNAIVKCLNFIKDGHFRINNDYLCDMQYMYICKDYIFTYENGKYYTTYNGDKVQVLSINNDKNLENYIKPTIIETGEICYGLVSLFDSVETADSSSIMKIKYKIRTKEIDINWQSNGRSQMKSEIVYEKNIIDGIPVYSIRKMYGDKDELNKFKLSALDAREEETIIIDLRSNPGGSDEYPNDWFSNYTGYQPNYPCSYGHKWTELSISASEKLSPDIRKYINKEAFDNMDNGKWSVYSYLGKWVENDNNVIVLIDKGVASSGETMIRVLRTMDNVVFVGSNSYGCALVPNQSNKYLPNSGIKMYFGLGLILTDDGENRDGIGYMPDIWVNPKDALDLAMKMCKFYNIK